MEGYVFSTVQPESNSESGSEYETDSSEELLSSNVGVQYKALTITDEERLEDYTKAKVYERVRNKYFTPEITKHHISVVLGNGSTTPPQSDLTLFGIDLDRVIGFKLVKGAISHGITDFSNHIDIIIPEIPYVACVKNAEGSHLIQRLSVYTLTAFYYENKNLFRDIYFTPIKLSSLTITHEHGTGGNLEFEITVLNHTE
jgi:hypothetical protein